jgi:hypothetical protein
MMPWRRGTRISTIRDWAEGLARMFKRIIPRHIHDDEAAGTRRGSAGAWWQRMLQGLRRSAMKFLMGFLLMMANNELSSLNRR